MSMVQPVRVVVGLLLIGVLAWSVQGEDPDALRKAFVDGSGPDWKILKAEDWTKVNCDEKTWTWKDDGTLFCTGQPVGVMRSQKQYTNFEMVLEWRHLKAAGNSGVFVWAPEDPLFSIKPGQLPHGIEVQILDHGYTEQYEKATGKKADWFSTDGDIFPVGKSKLSPFEPTSPNKQRSFPRVKNSKGVNEWNHYYIRAINGEVRLWVNGIEVSGGSKANPATGYLCLESEGSPIEFKNLRIRELP